MKTKNILPITEARKELFSLAKKVQKSGETFFLTERGKLKMVLISAEDHEKLCQRKSTLERAENKHILGALNFFRNIANFGLADFFSRDLWMSSVLVRDQGGSQYAAGIRSKNLQDQKNLVLAQLYVELNQKYNYKLNQVEIGKLVRIGVGTFRHFTEADIIVYDERGDVELLIHASPFETYENERQEALKELFLMADEISKHVKVNFLVYFSKSFENEKVCEKCMVIDIAKFRTYEKWKNEGEKFEDKIPARFDQGLAKSARV